MHVSGTPLSGIRAAHGALLLSSTWGSAVVLFYVSPLASLSPSCILHFILFSFAGSDSSPPSFFVALSPFRAFRAVFVGTVIHTRDSHSLLRQRRELFQAFQDGPFFATIPGVRNCCSSVQAASQSVTRSGVLLGPAAGPRPFLSLLFLYPQRPISPVCIIPSLPRLHTVVCSIGDPDGHSLLYLICDYPPSSFHLVGVGSEPPC